MWDVLGIPPSDDPRTIRRAYAARLKSLDPDRDPESFARLRKAFEWAIGKTAGGRASPSRTPEPNRGRALELGLRPRPETSDFPAGFDDGVRPAEAEQWSVLTAEDERRDRELLGALEQALRQGKAPEAITLYARAAATGALSLDGAADTLRRLFGVAAADGALSGVELRKFTATHGWDRIDSAPAADPEIRSRVQARLQAEDWYDGLLASAEVGGGAMPQNVARVLLRRSGRFCMPGTSSAALRSAIDSYRIYEGALGRRIDSGWILRLERRLRVRESFRLIFFCLFIVWLLIVATAALDDFLSVSVPRSQWSLLAIFVLPIVLLVLMFGWRVVRIYRLWFPAGRPSRLAAMARFVTRAGAACGRWIFRARK